MQYCVILTEGKDVGLRHYVWAFEEQIREAMKSLGNNLENNIDSLLSGGDVDIIETNVLGHLNIIETNILGHLNIIETNILGHPDIYACFNKERVGSLEVHTLNEALANWAAKLIKLPLPFLDF